MNYFQILYMCNKITGYILVMVCMSMLLQAGPLYDEFKEKWSKSKPSLGESITHQMRLDAKDYGISEIELERSRMDLNPHMPVYYVRITNKGEVFYFGEADVEKKGHYHGRIDSWKFNPLFLPLCEYIHDSEFINLKDVYDAGSTDASIAYTAVTFQGKKKIVKNIGAGGPSKLWVIEQLIDQILLETTWDKK